MNREMKGETEDGPFTLADSAPSQSDSNLNAEGQVKESKTCLGTMEASSIRRV